MCLRSAVFQGQLDTIDGSLRTSQRIVEPLTRLTRKDIRFDWDDRCETAFVELKQRLTSALILTVPNGQDPYVVYTDPSDTGLGCELMQNGKVVAYASRQLKIHERNIPQMTWSWQQWYLFLRSRDVISMVPDSYTQITRV